MSQDEASASLKRNLNWVFDIDEDSLAGLDAKAAFVLGCDYALAMDRIAGAAETYDELAAAGYAQPVLAGLAVLQDTLPLLRESCERLGVSLKATLVPPYAVIRVTGTTAFPPA